MKILNEINFIIIYFAFFIYIINKIIISREKYHFAISARDSWIRLSKPSKSRRRDHLRYFALFVNPDPCAQCKSGGDHLWQWWQQVRSWEHCVYSVPWGGGERERERERERKRAREREWHSLKGAFSDATIETEQLPALRNGTERSWHAYVCVPFAIILYRHNSKRIARDAGSPEVPNDLGLHVMRVERQTNGG